MHQKWRLSLRLQITELETAFAFDVHYLIALVTSRREYEYLVFAV